MKNSIGITGIAIAIIAIGIAIFQDDIRPEAPSVSTQLADKVSDVIAQFGGAEVQEKRSIDWISIAYIGLGFLALVIGIVSFLKKEDHRFSGMAGALGIVAIAWEYVLIGVVVAVVIYLLATFDF